MKTQELNGIADKIATDCDTPVRCVRDIVLRVNTDRQSLRRFPARARVFRCLDARTMQEVKDSDCPEIPYRYTMTMQDMEVVIDRLYIEHGIRIQRIECMP